MAHSKVPDSDSAHATKSSRKQGASREVRSTSPVKQADPTPSRPKATPRKRGPKPKLNGVTKGDDAKAASKPRRDATEVTPSVADSAADSDDPEEEEAVNALAEAAAMATAAAVADETNSAAATIAAVNGLNDDSESLREDTARVTVTSDVTGEGDAETVRTSVKIEMPVDSPEQPLPASPEAALQQAKDILAEAKDLQAAEAQSSRKRKADVMEIENPEEELVEVDTKPDDDETFGDEGTGSAANHSREPPAKRTRVMVPAVEFRRQKMQKRALMGLSATIAVG